MKFDNLELLKRLVPSRIAIGNAFDFVYDFEEKKVFRGQTKTFLTVVQKKALQLFGCLQQEVIEFIEKNEKLQDINCDFEGE
ncbi:MAG: hypothetical protein G01um101418_982 [Parcubacteria group bacterium Gr01-1014_18]|nr:MAG: hypothetical protein Greene041636_983 [Parcubacteria group bacterium Greene0416_36]TSC79423.1 MAG: hypothetical protein G01um101418_982 [Parcubacteria group bacterium Gr01-1014_18]TSC97803.1 MAG: hypothetical protein Greene101420_990 [Parcubacteria group bacterium Greene1014_20]TSD06013.1 MAG: hypothetical protein Greene07142_961 [Parcubacteria group bacterium Greene0714_2]